MTERQVSASNFDEAYGQATKEIPEKWYENERVITGLGVGVTVLLVWSRIFTSGSAYAPNLAGGALYGISAIADINTTIKDTSAQDRGAQNGFPRTTTEENPLLKNIVTTDDYRAAWKTRMAKEVFLFTLSTLFPDISVGLASSRFAAAINNQRQTKRYNRAVEIAINK